MSSTKFLQAILPKEKKFFNMFEAAAENLVKAAVLLNKLFLTNDAAEREKIMASIKDHENTGDDLTHKLYDELNKSFITPFDREDINKLNGSLDDVIDMINSFSQKLRYHPPKTQPRFFLDISELILQATREIKTAVSGLRNLKNQQTIMEACIRINEIENQADDIYHNALADLFENEKDAIELVKIKEMIAALEKATDMAEDVSDVIKGIIVKAG